MSDENVAEWTNRTQSGDDESNGPNRETADEAGVPKIKRSWIWPDTVERWFREAAEGRTLHVCCGQSDVGDVTVDRDPDNDPDVVADHESLPFPSASFDCAIWDPPWKIDPYQRHAPAFEVMRCIRVGGVLLANTRWVIDSDQLGEEEFWIRQDAERSYVSLLSRSVKFPGQQSLAGEPEVVRDA